MNNFTLDKCFAKLTEKNETPNKRGKNDNDILNEENPLLYAPKKNKVKTFIKSMYSNNNHLYYYLSKKKF